MTRLTANSYGKGGVRLTKVVRTPGAHQVFEMEVEIILEGGFENLYTRGDNSACIPTDTMKNTVYALAAKNQFTSPEQFALILTDHFIARFPHVSRAAATIEQVTWERIPIDGKPHEHSFVKTGGLRLALVRQGRSGGTIVQGGIRNLEVMKTTRSGFVGFLRDEFTTLKETTERIFGTSIDALWTYLPGRLEFNETFDTARRTILEVFATHDSLGVQQTLFDMGKRVLKNTDAIADIEFTMPNQHRILANLEPFGMTNNNEIFVNTSEPFGLIRGTITRD